MGFGLDSIKDAAMNALGKGENVDKVADLAKEKFSDQAGLIDKAADYAKGQLGEGEAPAEQ